jgi:uncharacterized membrane protein
VAEELDATVGPRDPDLTDREQHDVVLVRHIVQWLLRIGLALSIVLMAVGLVMKFVTGDHHSASVHLFELTRSMRTGDRLMAIGILVLAATPALRVVSLVVLWSWERDWRFVTIAFVVMLTLAAAVVIGHG